MRLTPPHLRVPVRAGHLARPGAGAAVHRDRRGPLLGSCPGGVETWTPPGGGYIGGEYKGPGPYELCEPSICTVEYVDTHLAEVNREGREWRRHRREEGGPSQFDGGGEDALRGWVAPRSGRLLELFRPGEKHTSCDGLAWSPAEINAAQANPLRLWLAAAGGARPRHPRA